MDETRKDNANEGGAKIEENASGNIKTLTIKGSYFKDGALVVCLIAVIAMGGLVIYSTGAYSQLNMTIENQTINSCASGCNTMLSLIHTNDTNVNAAALAACWNACGGNVQQT